VPLGRGISLLVDRDRDRNVGGPHSPTQTNPAPPHGATSGQVLAIRTPLAPTNVSSAVFPHRRLRSKRPTCVAWMRMDAPMSMTPPPEK
jgi:hypothetical protein